MPLLNDHYTLTLCTHYASALINGDYSGLDDSEAADLDVFMRDYWNLQDATLNLSPDSEHYFGIDEVSGLYADVIDFQLYFTNHLLNPQQHALDLN
jgi:hypothetical protein